MVGVQSWVGEGQNCTGVVQDAANVPASDVRQACVTGLIVEQRLAVLPQRLVSVHARAVVASQRLRHKRDRLALFPGGVLDDVLEGLQIICSVQHRVELVVDFLLAASADLVVGSLQVEAGVGQLEAHFVAQILVMVVWGDREVAALQASLVTQVRGSIWVLVLASVPPAFDGVNFVEAAVGVGFELNVVEDIELGLSAEEAGIGDSGGD